jgi:hypothetical protein
MSHAFWTILNNLSDWSELVASAIFYGGMIGIALYGWIKEVL